METRQETVLSDPRAVSAQPSTQRSLQCRMRDITDLDPSSPAEIIEALTPVLSLTAPTGMDTEAKRLWFNAARTALHGIPIALLKRGAQAAMSKADHPAKIVPAIHKAVAEDWEWRRKHRANPRPQPEAYLPRVPDSEAKEVAVELEQLASRMKATTPINGDRPHRPEPKVGTVDQYTALGLSREEAEAAVAMHEREHAKWHAEAKKVA